MQRIPVVVQEDGDFGPVKEGDSVQITIPTPTPLYLSYVAIIHQENEFDPTATVLENTLGVDIIWTRDGAGQYKGNASGVLTTGMTWAQATSRIHPDKGGMAFHVDSDSFMVLVACDRGLNFVDNIVSGTCIEIRVYQNTNTTEE